MKKLLTLFAVLAAVYLFADCGKCIIDNDHIQRYNGAVGRWENVTSYSNLCYKMRKYGTNLSNVLKYNDNVKKGYAAGYCFIPFSDKYIEKLKKDGNYFKKVDVGYESFIWPINVPIRITSNLGPRWGRFHKGLDMAAMVGTPIYAAKEGIVEEAKYMGGYGNVVILEHRENFSTKYAHNSQLFVKKGDFVQQGQLIALVGSSGRSTGAHLHFEIRCDAIPLDPIDFLPESQNVKLLHTMSDWKATD